MSDACHLLRIFGAFDQTRCRASKQRELTHAELVMTYYPHNIHHKDCPNGAPLSLERTAHIDPDSLVANVTFAQFERYCYIFDCLFFIVSNSASRKLF